MADIIVAIICNLIVTLILVSGVLSAISNGVRVTLVKLGMTIIGGVGAYFLTPVISGLLYKVEGVIDLLKLLNISYGTINSCIFLVWFLLFYAITIFVCNIIRHRLIKSLRDKKLNKLKMRRARSINPQAERLAERAEWRSLKIKYAKGRKWYHRLLAGFVGGVVAIIVGFIVLMPYGYIAKDINHKGDKPYVEKGYEYTLNGLVGEKVFDFLTHTTDEVE